MYDYYIQLNLSAVNGKSLNKLLFHRKASTLSAKDEKSGEKAKVTEPQEHATKKDVCKHQHAIASVFFRFSHRDQNGNTLTNKEQKVIIEDLYAKLQAYLTKRKDLSSPSQQSHTYLQFYDSLIEEKQPVINKEDRYGSAKKGKGRV